MWWVVALVLLAGAVCGYAAGRLLPRSRPAPPAPPEEPRPELAAVTIPVQDESLPAPMRNLLRNLPGIVVVVNAHDAVVHSSRPARDRRMIRRGQLAFESIAECAEATRAMARPYQTEVTVRRPPLRKGVLELRVRGIPLPAGHTLLLIDDLTEERRVAAVRRDFIANVSHELKTPVGAVSLLSEAIVAARDDPEAVQHFAHRMQKEADRLGNLINDVIDLSRLQGDDPMSHAAVVEVDDLVHGAVDFVRAAAEAKQIEVVVGGLTGMQVFGDPVQLETALRNVLSNAVGYSDQGTRVALAVRATEVLVELDVKDQGIGIPESEQSRIFERFYRVDEARSRMTGGTGLGLSIVRNVCRNHGGDVLVWSVENEGSTFTLQLPRFIPGEDDEEADMEEVMEQAEREEAL